MGSLATQALSLTCCTLEWSTLSLSISSIQSYSTSFARLTLTTGKCWQSSGSLPCSTCFWASWCSQPSSSLNKGASCRCSGPNRSNRRGVMKWSLSQVTMTVRGKMTGKRNLWWPRNNWTKTEWQLKSVGSLSHTRLRGSMSRRQRIR